MRVVVSLWLVILTAVSLMPDRFKFRLGTKGAFHRVDHFVIFAITALIFCWTATGLQSRLWRAAGACFAAFVLEWMEAFFYHNHVEWRDVWIGCLGAALGFVIASIIQVTKRKALGPPFSRLTTPAAAPFVRK